MAKEIKKIHFSETEIWTYVVGSLGRGFNIYSPEGKLYKVNKDDVDKINSQDRAEKEGRIWRHNSAPSVIKRYIEEIIKNS